MQCVRITSHVTIVATVLCVSVVLGGETGTAFTYQGQLKDAGLPANGAYDFEFTLFDDATAGSRVSGPIRYGGGEIGLDPVDVVNGLFHVELDFGDVYDGTALWLQLSVRLHGDRRSYTPLDPRQPLTATPFAVYAMNATTGGGSGLWSTNGANIYNNNTGKVGIGTSSPAFDLHTKQFVLSGLGQPAATLGLHWSQATIPATNDWLYFRVGGTFLVPTGQTGTHVVRPTGKKLHFSVEDTMNSYDYTSQMTLSENGRLGIGTNSPAFPLHIRSAQPYAQFDDTGGGSSWLVGVQGPSVGFNVQELGGATRFVINDGGNVGIGTTSPEAKLQVVGGGDASPAGGGFLVLGSTSGQNIAIDSNEIMARFNGGTSNLYLNNDGGDIVCGGSLYINYSIVTGLDTATCPAGTKVLGGGCRIVGDAEIRQSYPSGNAWHCGSGDQVGFVELETYAICANVK